VRPHRAQRRKRTRHPGHGIVELRFVAIAETEPHERLFATVEIVRPRALEPHAGALAGERPRGDIDVGGDARP
jgi:hypothetical protein